MGDIHRLPGTEETERMASEWFARMNADDVTAQDRARFETWLGEHPRHAEIYADLCGTWRELVEAGPLVRAVNFGQVMNAATTPPPRRRRWMALAAAAAVGVLALGIGWNVYKQREQSGFQTAVGEQAAVALADGSSFDLNTNSRVSVTYSPRTRVIHLERGEAYFKVAHDTQRPFWVQAGRSWVRAVGTAFNVYLGPAGVVVTVSEGTVNVVNANSDDAPPVDPAGGGPVQPVTAGEQVDVHDRAKVIHELNPAQISRLLGWRKGSLYFQDQPLGEVVDELARYTTLQIELAQELRQLPVGGTFQTSPEGAEALLTMLQDGFGATIHREGPDHVYVERSASAQ